VGQGSNVGKAFFIILTYTSALFDRMIMSGAASILTRGIIEERTGIEILWSQWLQAYLPAILITLLASWYTVRWLYPPEKNELDGGKRYLQQSLRELGPWSQNEKKTLLWLLAAILLWVTDFVHHISPSVIALGTGLFLVLPGIGVLDKKAVKQVNLFAIVFSAGALSMGNVLGEAQALQLVTERLLRWSGPLLSDSLHGAAALYSGGFLYHFLLANDQSMLSTALPVLLQFSDAHGLNPVAIGLIWNFATGARLFIYQSSVLVLGYSYGYFEGKDLIKVGLLLTVVQGVLLILLVETYWPLIGLSWTK
jgi:di/tricarboxylate transporter